MTGLKYPGTIPGFLAWRLAQSPEAVACYHREGESGWKATTWSEYAHSVQQIASFLRRRGLEKGDRVAIMIPTGREWEYAEKAALSLGCVVVGIEPHATSLHKRFVIGQSGATTLIVSSYDDLAALENCPVDALKLVLSLEDSAAQHGDNRFPWSAAFGEVDDLDEHLPRSSDPATLIYTSGTTGDPKGILYTHRQCMLACQSLLEVYDNFGADDNVICWMPLASLFQRIMNLCAIGTGSRVYFIADPQAVMEYVAEIKPAVFIGVPRFYEKLYSGIMERIAGMSPLVRPVVTLALEIARRQTGVANRDSASPRAQSLVYRISDRLILNRFRAVMGGNIQYLISGSAPCPAEVLEFFAAIGMPLLEAYGMSENIIPVTANGPGDYRLGSVGKPMRLNDVLIAEDGEVLVRGEGVFSGYYAENDPDRGFNSDGFFASGDYGHFDEEGYLFLQGRKNEIIKTSTGRRIALNRIEARLKQVPLIDQVVVIGYARKFLVAVLSLDSDRLAAMKSTGIGDKDHQSQGIDAATLTAVLAKEIPRACADLAQYEQIAGCIIPSETFTVEGGELTPNLKIRRPAIEAKYHDEIQQLDADIERLADENSSAVHKSMRFLCLNELY
ncbi:AMP-dependent synthetase/ligase [Seongchinamella sediminis]|uniref:AMP-dependent synthetase/ligase n=1 Tax=Seongchinamella sediminis TaxID=2283635 RepID=UPI0013C35C25|nr:AMP-binding protein [Seongchinamella sediminis]